MSKETHKLAAQTRTAFGDNASRRLRRAGMIPAVVYSKGVEPRSLQVSADEWKVISAHGTQIITLVEGEKETPVLIREVQFNHLKNYVVHIDFQQVDLNKEISAKVVLHAVGDCYGAAHGGILEQELHELEVLCRPADLPELIKVDVASLDIGQALSVKDLVLPEGVRTNVDPEEIVFHVVMPQIEAEPAPEEAAAEPAEPEAINEKKTEARAAEKAAEKK